MKIIVNGNYINGSDQEVIVNDVIDGDVVIIWVDQDAPDVIDEDEFKEHFSLVSPKTEGIKEPTKRQFQKLLNS